MLDKSHIILGLCGETLKKVEQLRGQGINDIYIVDYEQPSTVKEKNGVFYLSPDGALIVANRKRNVTYHYHLYIKRRKDID